MKDRLTPSRFTVIFLFFFLFCAHYLVMAQAPQSLSYQAIIRDQSGNLVKEQTVRMQISILHDSDTGKTVYSETHTAVTNTNGLVSIAIGQGSVVSGLFTEIDWATGPYFIKTETDPTGGSNYTIAGVNPLLSVPYALYAQYAGNAGDSQLLPGTQRGNTMYWDGEKWVASSNYLFNSGQRIGIGTDNPATNLHITGSLRIENETQGAGKVLTSDALGNATWEESATGNFYGIVVDASGGGDYTTISDAIANVEPSADDPVTIFVRAGIYRENLNLKSYITLQGEAVQTVIVKGFENNSNDNAMVRLDSVSHVYLNSITFTRDEETDGVPLGVRMVNSQASFNTIHILGDWEFFVNNVLRGIVADDSRLEFVDGKITEQMEDAILLNNSIGKVVNSELSSTMYNVYVGNGSVLDFIGSTAIAGLYGVYVSEGGEAKIYNSAFRGNGTGVNNQGKLSLVANHIHDSQSIAGLVNTGVSTVIGNTFTDCVLQAIIDIGSQGSTITGNIIENSSHGGEPAATILNATSIISNNIFQNNTHGDMFLPNNDFLIPYITGNIGNVINATYRAKMAGIEDMHIDRSGDNLLLVLPEQGNVGLGTTEPEFTFHIETSSTQRGLFVNHTATAGTRYGIWGRSAAISGTGVRADATHATGTSYGLWANAESSSGSAVFASANATSGNTFGVQAYSLSSSGRGVYGHATSLSGTNYGVYGRTNSAGGYAGYFQGGRNYFQGRVGIGALNPETSIHITDGNDHLKISGSSVVKDGPSNFALNSAGNMVLTSGMNLNMNAGTNMNLNSPLNMNLSSSAAVSISSGIQTTLSSSSMIRIIGALILVNGPTIMSASSGGVVLSVDGNAAKPGGGSWSVLSDRQLKTSIETLGPGVLDQLLSLKGYTYEYSDSALKSKMVLPGRQTGLIAQQVQKVFPEWVDADDEGYLFITERGLTAIMVEALRELREEKDAEIEVLRIGNMDLRIRLEKMETLIQNLVESGGASKQFRVENFSEK
ncbi:MAG: hypothetical protein EA361_16010 [Bacteroidetes bacterium]|nr:MAG: hypothetical protein EA361_16010 [Bacteroidota bacterium]